VTDDRIKPITPLPEWEPVEQVSAMSREAVQYSDFSDLATLAMSLHEGAKAAAKALRKTSPDLAAYYEGVSFGWYMTWWLLYEQAKTLGGDVGPVQFALSLEEPMLAVMKNVATAAKHAYAAALRDFNRTTGEQRAVNDEQK